MLPDYTRAKKRIHEFMERWLRQRVRFYLGPFAFKEYRAFEGRSFAVKTEDDQMMVSDPKELSGKIQVSFTDVQSDNPKVILQHLDRMAMDIAASQRRAILEQLGKTCEESGQIFDARGGPLTAEIFFHLLDTIQIDFDEYGKANSLAFVFGPELAERVEKTLEELNTSPNLKVRYDDLMERKRTQWRDREASRKLVG